MSKINKSWEADGVTAGELHSPEGIKRLRENVKTGLKHKFYGIAQTMYRWDGMEEDEKFKDMLLMSQGVEPEHFLFQEGQAVAFEMEGQIQILPVVFQGGLNIYGRPNQWKAVPVGFEAMKASTYPKVWQEIYSKKLDHSNSVYMRNDIFTGTDKAYIDSQIDMLVDNMMTVNQLQLISKMPFIFNVTKEQYLTAKNYYLALCQDSGVIFTNKMTEDITPVVEKVDVKIDPALFEIYDRVECQILEYLGFPCVPITKRAQQTESETNSNSDMINARRQERLRMRQKAADRMNELFGTNVEVVSIIDEEIENEREAERMANALSESDSKSDSEESA